MTSTEGSQLVLPPPSDPLGESSCQILGLTAVGKEIVERIRRGDPVRRPRPGTQSWAGAEFLDLMGFTVGVESRTLERAFYRLVPREPDLVEIYDQCYELDLSVIKPDGKRLPDYVHVPDALCIRRHRVHFTECKRWDKLVSISEKYPDRYVLGADGRWSSPAAERSLEGSGIGYEVFTDRDINPTVLRNVNFLRDFESEVLPPETLLKLTQAFENALQFSITELLSKVADRKLIYTAIVSGHLYFDLARDLANSDDSLVYRDKAACQCDAILRIQAPREVLNVEQFDLVKEQPVELDGISGEIADFNESNFWIRLNDGSLRSFLRSTLFPLLASKRLRWLGDAKAVTSIARARLAEATHDELQRAIGLFKCVSPWLSGSRRGGTTRSIRRWLKKYREAEAVFGSGLVGLLDRVKLRGNRLPRLSEMREQKTNEVIQTEYLDNARSIDGALAILNSQLSGVDERRVSRRAFVRRIDRIVPEDRERRRHGVRMGNAARAPHDVGDQPVKGERAFEVGLIDSFSVPMKVLSRRTDRPIDTPLWGTLLWNAYPPHPLGLALQFAKPSTRSVMAACRDCVRRFNRLPDNIYHDLGSEHGGLTFDLMKAEYQVNYLNRAAGNARFGADIEAHIGSLKNMIREYSGSFKRIPRRGGSASHSPEARTKWYWDEFDPDVRTLVFEDWPDMEHDGIATLPGELFRKSLGDQGDRPSRFIAYDDTFMVLTMPIVKAAATIHPTRGIRHDYVWYYDRQLSDPRWHKSPITLREPVDEAHLIAQLGGNWVRCEPVSYVFRLFTQREIRLLAEEWKGEARASNSKARLTPEAFERFMERVAAKEKRFDEQRKAPAATEAAPAPASSPVPTSTPAPAAAPPAAPSQEPTINVAPATQTSLPQSSPSASPAPGSDEGEEDFEFEPDPVF